MIPSALTAQLERGIADFLRYSFWSSTPGMEHVIDDLIGLPGGITKGPYLSVKLPFVKGRNKHPFRDIEFKYTPHAHQEAAFGRLNGRRKLSTLMATGTGSGKTECFLLPILQHCLDEASTPGIKAIIVYPMNALATDQAERIAGLIHDNSALRGRVTAGLYIGEDDKKKRIAEKQMGRKNVITDRETMEQRPPSILLTNYKMLDLLLLRPWTQGIWQHNHRGILRFLVVDELHTFDGAQGTDLSCLIRRLKRRLQADDGALCCVGTSATLGSEDSGRHLIDYAGQVFGEPFDEDSVIGESRVDASTFLADTAVAYTDEPEPSDFSSLHPEAFDDPEAWLDAQERLWFGASGASTGNGSRGERLADGLVAHATFRVLLARLDNQTASLWDLVTALARGRTAWRDNPAFGRAALLSLMGLDVRIQLWQRELRRMTATVADRPKLSFSDDLDREQKRRRLPMVHCRDCGAMGWGTKIDKDKPHLFRCNQATFYTAFFKADPHVRFLFPKKSIPPGDVFWAHRPTVTVDSRTLARLEPEEESDGEAVELVVVESTRQTDRGPKLHRDCPFCDARESLTLLGFRAATLTSAYIDQIFASRFNNSGAKKLLAFSDSVQDAAHRAGFFGARTWRTNLRVAMRRVISEAGDGLSLKAVSEQLTRYWQDRLGKDAWIATFIAPNMFWLHDWDALQKGEPLSEDSDLVTMISKRLGFETAVEFGLQAGIGRSLLRTKAASVFIDHHKLNRACEALLEPLQNEVPGLRQVSVNVVRSFVLGMLRHLQTRGGIFCEEIPLPFIESLGNDLHAFKRGLWGVYLPSFGKTSRLPAFLTDKSGTLRFDSWARSGSASSWYEQWALRCFKNDAQLVADAASIYPLVLIILAREGLVKEIHGTKQARVYGVSDDAVIATTRVTELCCDACGHRIVSAPAEKEIWRETPCLTARCSGRYKENEDVSPDYFGRLYAHGDLQRIFTAEHTGLLSREERESVERRFKAEIAPTEADDEQKSGFRKPWDPNLLSCTPTLEMGIDIGDLSSTLLCSVPPTQASYLQRIGRAGRRDGNAFILALAMARPHDLYFYAAPEEMIAGEVSPPGVFLDASAVLERQMAAFCFDRWVAKEGDAAELPRQLKDIFPHLGKDGGKKFPYGLLGFIDREHPTILREFQEMFANEISPVTILHLKNFLSGSLTDSAGLAWRILDLFQREKKQLESLQGKAKQLLGEIQKLQESEAKPIDFDVRIENLEDEREALLALAKEIRGRNTLQFLTDEGMLPNYAFPESAVRLNSVIWRRKKRISGTEKSKYDTWTYEYARSPSSALSELAPNSDFYAGGRRVTIDQVDVSVSEIESWRFCDACSHAQRENLVEPSPSCPACGSTTWGDTDQCLNLLPLRQVFANAPDRDSRIRDDQDERRPRFYMNQMLMDHRSADRQGAWSIDAPKWPFGFEFLKKATFRDINFGENTEDGHKCSVAGREAVRPGFKICTRCGKVQDDNGEPVHSLSCPAKTRGEKDTIEPALYLYREFSSEALRLLLPMADIGTNRKIHSFLAALQLGLKTRFGGSVDHIKTMVYSEPDKESALRRQYLVLFDSVPGGTGYLKQLIIPAEKGGKLPLMEVLEMARDRIKSCSCYSDPDKDGCYKCLLAYRNAKDMDDTSADEAVELLEGVLSHWNKLKEVKSLGEVSVSGLMDSVLEARFIEALKQTKHQGKLNRVKYVPYKGKPAFHLTVGDLEWHVEPQVELGNSDGFPMGISVDFMLWPASNILIKDGRKPIAVLLDGFRYHSDQIGYDLIQRQLLLASGRFDVWCLTWYDLDETLGLISKKPVNLVHEDIGVLRQRLKQFGLVQCRDTVDETTFDWLLDELATLETVPWKKLGESILAARMKPVIANGRTVWQKIVAKNAPEVLRASLEISDAKLLLSDKGELSPWVEIYAAYEGTVVKYLIVLDDTDGNIEAPGFVETWNGYLRLFQLLRAVPNGWFVTKSAMGTSAWQHLVRMGERPDDSESWTVTLDVDTAFHDICGALQRANVPKPEVGMDIPDKQGNAWAEAELFWEEERIALTDRARVESARGQADSRFRVFILEELPSADAVIQLFDKKGDADVS